MKLLLDTNIILHREGKDPINPNIGKLFLWIDRLGYEKCVHRVTINEITKIQDSKVREAFLLKLESYRRLRTVAPLHQDVETISKKYDTTENDRNDTALLNEVFTSRVDLLLTEDKKIHQKAQKLGIDAKIFTIESFLKKATSENRELLEYKVLAVRREFFGNINLNDKFFDSLREDYRGFNKWFVGKSDEMAYVCRSDGKVLAFLYLKIENEDEPYSDIDPVFIPARRLKIGTFKVQLSGFKLGERFLKIIFDNALYLSVKELYVTIFPVGPEQKALIKLLESYGFHHHGTKKSSDGIEEVYVRDFSRVVSRSFPKKTYPYLSNKSRKFIVAIYPQYHTSLFPDSLLQTEEDVENEPHRNAIAKVFVSKSPLRSMTTGDIIIFYRTGGLDNGIITTFGVVEDVKIEIKDFNTFKHLCRQRSVFLEEDLKKQWEEKSKFRPFVVNFLYCYTLRKNLSLRRLIEMGILKVAPMGFKQIPDSDFEKIIKETDSNDIIVN
jgi:predicted nucleic acid-binding protein